MSQAKPLTDATTQLLKTLQFEPGIAVERQVVKHLRSLITQGTLAPKTRIPPIRTLASSWNTNYFTIQAALRQLVREHLLVQSPKLGTFVAPFTRKLAHVGLYHAQALGSKGFYGQLNLQLYRLLSERGVTSHAFFDSRPENQKKTMPPDLQNLLKDREIDGLIISAFNHISIGWINRIQIPASLLTPPKSLARFGGIQIDADRFAELALDSVIKAKRNRIGILALDPQMTTALENQAALRGIEVARIPDLEVTYGQEFDEVGFRICEQFLSLKNPPDALICFPDDCTRGAINCLLQRSVKVPKTLLVISHQNQEMPFFSPFPIVRLTVRVEDFAQALIAQLDAQIAGEPILASNIIPYLAES